MKVPAPRIRADVLDDGTMELRNVDSGRPVVCDEIGTAVWIALCRSSWSVGDAAFTLAAVWSLDPWLVRDVVLARLRDFERAGLVVP